MYTHLHVLRLQDAPFSCALVSVSEQSPQLIVEEDLQEKEEDVRECVCV